MTPLLLFPAGLAALVALTVPLAIHLARRSEMRRTDFAALRWLAAKARPKSRPRVDELLLLAIRLLLLALVALWLARPALDGAVDPTPWLAVVPGVDPAAIPATPGTRRHWLAPGFPALDTPAPRGPLPIASLLRQLDAELPPGVGLTVVVPATLAGADAERLRLSRAVAWRIGGGTMPATGVTPPSPSRLTVRFAPHYAAALRYLHAAAVAWASPGAPADFAAAAPNEPLPRNPGALVWLAPGRLPPAVKAWIEGGGTALVAADTTVNEAADAATGVVWRDDVGAPLVEQRRQGRGRLLRLVRAMTPEAMPQLLEPDFAAQLRALFAGPAAPPARVAAVDYAPLTGGASYAPAARDLRPWLALLVAALFLGERWLATGRRVRT